MHCWYIFHVSIIVLNSKSNAQTLTSLVFWYDLASLVGHELPCQHETSVTNFAALEVLNLIRMAAVPRMHSQLVKLVD